MAFLSKPLLDESHEEDMQNQAARIATQLQQPAPDPVPSAPAPFDFTSHVKNLLTSWQAPSDSGGAPSTDQSAATVSPESSTANRSPSTSASSVPSAMSSSDAPFDLQSHLSNLLSSWQDHAPNTSSVDASGGAPYTPAGSAVSSAPAGLSQPAGAFANNDERLAYVRQSAIAHGHDPETAARVAMSEGAGPAGSVGDQGTSFGALQAHVGGGQGDDFKAQTGLDPSDPKNERALIDWQLSNLGQTGWAPFHGAQAIGVGDREGVSTGQPSNSRQVPPPSSSGAQNAPAAAMPSNSGGQYAPGSYTPNQINAATSEGLDYETALAVCGPAAAIAFARKTGRNPTMQEALGLAKQAGWTVGAGMAGPASEQQLLRSMGVAAKLHDGVPDWSAVASDVSNGNPVIISTPGHYFVAEQYDPATGKFNFGNSAAILRKAGGQTWFTPDEMASLGMGAPRASLFMDSPTSPAPSVVAGQSQQPAQMNRMSLTQPQGGDQWENSAGSSPSMAASPTASMNVLPTPVDSQTLAPDGLMLRQPLSTPTSGPDSTPTFQDSQTEPATPQSADATPTGTVTTDGTVPSGLSAPPTDDRSGHFTPERSIITTPMSDPSAPGGVLPSNSAPYDPSFPDPEASRNETVPGLHTPQDVGPAASNPYGPWKGMIDTRNATEGSDGYTQLYRQPLAPTGGPDTFPTDAPLGVGASAAPGQPTPGAGAFQDDQTQSGWNPAGAAPGPQVPDMSGTGYQNNNTAPNMSPDSPTLDVSGVGTAAALPLKPVWDAAGTIIGYVHDAVNPSPATRDQVNAYSAEASGQNAPLDQPIAIPPRAPRLPYSPEDVSPEEAAQRASVAGMQPGQHLTTPLSPTGYAPPEVAARDDGGADAGQILPGALEAGRQAVQSVLGNIAASGSAASQGKPLVAVGDAVLAALDTVNLPFTVAQSVLNDVMPVAHTSYGDVGLGDVVITAQMASDGLRLLQEGVKLTPEVWRALRSGEAVETIAARLRPPLNAAAGAIDNGISTVRSIGSDLRAGAERAAAAPGERALANALPSEGGGPSVDAVAQTRANLSPVGQDLMQVYDEVTPQRVEASTQRSLQIAQDAIVAQMPRRGPMLNTPPGELLQQTHAAIVRNLEDSKVVATGLRQGAIEAFLRGEGLTTKVDARDAEKIAKITQAQVNVAGGRAEVVNGQKVKTPYTLQQAADFATRESQQMEMATGGTRFPNPTTGAIDEAAPRVNYAYVTEGQPLIGPNRPNLWLVWDENTPRITSAHHPYALGSPGQDIHASMPPGLKAALWSEGAVKGGRAVPGPGGQPIVAGWQDAGRTIGGGRPLAETNWLVGPEGENAMRANGLILSMPKDVQQQIARGQLTDPEQIAGVLMRGGAPQWKSGWGSVVSAQRSESLIVDPSLANVKAIYLTATPKNLQERMPNTGIARGMSKSKSDNLSELQIAQHFRQQIMEQTGKDVPILFTDISKAGAPTLISDAKVLEGPAVTLAPGRKGITDAYQQAGRPFIGAVPAAAADAPTRTIGPALSAAANVAGQRGIVGAGVGGVSGAVTGYETAPDDATTGERLGRAAEFGVGGVAAGTTLAVGGTLAGGQLIDSLISSGKLDPRVLATHPQVADRVKALFALAAEGLPDDAPVPVPAMASAIASFSAKTQRELASLLYDPVTAGQVRQIVGDAGSPGVAQTVKEMVTDAITGLGNRARRGRELAADAATVNGIPQSWQDAAAGRVGESASTLATDYGPAARVNPETQPNLTNFVNEVADKLGVPRPGIYVAPSLSVNASATADAGAPALVLTRGILKANLTDDEMAAILTHELAHTAQPQQQSAVGRAFGAVKDAFGNVVGSSPREMANALPGGGNPPQLPPQVQQAVQQAQATQQPGLSPLQWTRKFAAEVGYSSMIGPATATVNLLGNVMEPIWSAPKEAVRGVVRAGQTGNMSALREPGEMAKAGLARVQIATLQGLTQTGQAMVDALMARGRYAATPGHEPLSQLTNNPIGKAITTGLEFGGRVFSSIPDAFFGSIAEHAGEARAAAQQATDLGHSGTQWKQTVSQLLNDAQAVKAGTLMNPSPEVIQVIKDGQAYAKRQTFQDPLGDWGKNVRDFATVAVAPDGQGGRKPLPVIGSMLTPFFNTPWNMALRQAERTPAGFAMKSQPTRFDKMYDATVGSALVLGMGGLAAQGVITGNGPNDPQKRSELRSQGWRPYSTLINGVYVPNRVLGIYGPLMNAAGDVHDSIAYAKDNSPGSITSDFLGRVGQQIQQQPYLQGISNLMQAIQAGQGGGLGSAAERFASSNLTRMVPYAATGRTIGAAIDPLDRTTNQGKNVPAMTTIGEQVRSGIGNRQGFPQLGQQPLPASQDVLGQPQANPQQGAAALFAKTSDEHPNQAVKAFLDAGVDIGFPKSTLTIDTIPVALSPDETRQWQTYRGDVLQRFAPNLPSQPWWNNPTARQAAMKQLLNDANTAADQQLMRAIGPSEIRRRTLEARQQQRQAVAP